MDPNTNMPPEPPKRSALAEIVTGTAMGTIIGLITSLFNTRVSRARNAIWGAVGGAALAGVLYHFGSKKQPNTPELPPTPPTALPPSGQSYGFALASVPQILDLLVERNQLTAAQKETVLGEIKAGRTGFAGEIALADGFVSKQQLDDALLTQATRKAEAAVTDMGTIAGLTSQDSMIAPQWLRSNWGNNGVNPSPATPSRVDGAAAAANAAQNLVMVAHEQRTTNPAALATLQEGVVAAANLSRGIANGDSAVTPLSRMSAQWIDSMNRALVTAAQIAPSQMKDANGNALDINQFTTARTAEITAAVNATLQSPGMDQSPTR